MVQPRRGTIENEAMILKLAEGIWSIGYNRHAVYISNDATYYHPLFVSVKHIDDLIAALQRAKEALKELKEVR